MFLVSSQFRRFVIAPSKLLQNSLDLSKTTIYRTLPVKQITKKWISLADYDLKSAGLMLQSRRYLYVTFMCQQSVEKYLKAIIAETTDRPPAYTHNLQVLAEITGIGFTENQVELLSILTRHYINSRYPGVKESLSKSLTSKVANNLFTETKVIIRCLKKELKMLTR
jgi:HEPN domain-containing protein